MGRAAGVSCFRVIICGKDNREVVPRQASENKVSSGRKWSFRKRSTPQTFMSSVVISEPVLVNNECSDTVAPHSDSSFNMSTVVISEPVLVNNECSETVAPNFEGLSNMTLPEQQISLIQETEVKTEPLSQPNHTEPDSIACVTNDSISDIVFEEHSVILIQAVIRGFLDRRLILKQTSVIKLQAAVRGHLVRRQAMGTLRCIQSIIKMQVYVRARRTLALIEESINLDPEFQRGRGVNNLRRTSSQISIEMLQENRFARKLMASAKFNNNINVKCEALKADCAWDWFQRWMSIAYVNDKDTQASVSSLENHQVTPSDSALLNISEISETTEIINPTETEIVNVAESSSTEVKDTHLISNVEANYSSVDNKEDIGTDAAKNLPTMESNALSIATGSRFGGRSSYNGSETEASEAEKDYRTPRVRTRARKSESSRYTRSVPSYMQATESARHRTSMASGSPKFHSDVLDMSIYIGRRSSTDGIERYPCVLRSLHRSQQSDDGTAIHSPRVVSQRRWMH